MSDGEVFPVPESWAKKAHMDAAGYEAAVREVETDPDAYWRKIGGRLDWIKPFTQVKDVSFNSDDFRIRWFADGVLNVSVNCLDRHLPDRADEIAIIWESDDPAVMDHVTYSQLLAEVCRMANVLKAKGVRKGDRVTIYLPMIPQAAVAMLACARIGAVHSVVFGGFSPDSLAGRIQDCDSKIVITADEGVRGGKIVPLKLNVDEALKECPGVTDVIVVRRTKADVPMMRGRDAFYGDLKQGMPDVCEPEPMGAEDPLFILYTSGSTGKPKGVLHTTGGYLAWAAHTHEIVFDYRPGEVFFCTADVGWVTGHSYIVYGPLANAATTLIFEGVPNYPTSSRFWEVIDKHKVEIFYTAPTALRALMREGEEPVKRTSRKSLRLLGTVGEPINPEAWLWYHRVVGEGRCPIVDTYWQTETGACLASPLPGATALKPGSCTKPMPGVKFQLVDAEGKVLDGAVSGNLCITDSWPGQMRTVYGDHERFFNTYFSTYAGKYFTGDGCRRDEDGYYWITGRVDDVINVSGHRLGTAEIESALVGHQHVAEAAVVGYPHEVKGQGIYCYVTLNAGVDETDILAAELKGWVRREIGPFAAPDVIQFAPGLPKTRSGKIMRRILRKIAENDLSNLGDTSTLADPAVVDDLVQNRGGSRLSVEPPPLLRAAIERELSGVSRRGLAERAGKISTAYRAGQGSARVVAEADDALAYALSRLPATYAACAAVFAEARRMAPDFAPARLLDVGTGPGGAAWAAVEAWPGIGAAVQLEAAKPFLDLAKRLAAEAAPTLRSAELIRADLMGGQALPAADLVTASYVLAEIPQAQQEALVDRLWSACEGVLTLIEPGTPAGFERLRAARARLVEAGATILAPCPHDGACPLTAPDWCHFVQRLPRSRDHRLAKGADAPFEDEKYAYVLAARPGVAASERTPRILAPPRAAKPGITLKLCTEGGVETAFVARRDKAAHAAARRFDWGDAMPGGTP